MSRPRGRRIAAPPPERVARRRLAITPTAVLGVVLPVLTVGALALAGDPENALPGAVPPQERPLSLAILACPGDLGGDQRVTVASANGAAGPVDVDVVGSDQVIPVQVSRGATATVTASSRPVTVRGKGRMAPGLLAARQDAGPASVACTLPAADQWFTGLGAAARHSSTLDLVNPDPGPAVADLTVLGPGGPVDAPDLRGITVPGGRSLRLDLSQQIPHRGELAVRVQVSRGRLGAYAADSFDELGRGDSGTDWLAAQLPGTELTMLGLPPGEGTRSLAIANPGEDEVRATVRVVTGDSAFLPEGLDEVRVAPGSVTRIPMTAILGPAVRDGAVGLQIEATHPVTATLRSFVAGDVSHVVPLPSVIERTEAIVPRAPGDSATLLVTGDRVGTATVVSVLSDGSKKRRTVELAPGRTLSVELPEGTSVVRLVPSATAVRGAVLVTTGGAENGGATVVGLRDLVLTGLVPDARPALP